MDLDGASGDMIVLPVGIPTCMCTTIGSSLVAMRPMLRRERWRGARGADGGWRSSIEYRIARMACGLSRPGGWGAAPRGAPAILAFFVTSYQYHHSASAGRGRGTIPYHSSLATHTLRVARVLVPRAAQRLPT